jgi:hypothetical protein
MKFDNIGEHITGIIISSIFCNLIDFILYKLAFNITGSITIRYDGSYLRSTIHWIIRCVFMLFVIVIGFTGVYEAILTPITHDLYIAVRNFWNNQMNELLKALTPET